MALSNWDTTALTHDGQVSDGSFCTPLGVAVEFYKNWLYVRDPAAWRKGGGYVEPTVMEVREGSFQYLDLGLVAVRGPQNGVYAVVWTGWGHDGTLKGIAGAGVYGFEGQSWVGVQPASLAWWRDRLNATHKEDLDLDLDGQSAYDEHDLDVPACFRTLDWSAAGRFNQGDAYFAGRLGASLSEVVTPPGQADAPMLLQALGKSVPK